MITRRAISDRHYLGGAGAGSGSSPFWSNAITTPTFINPNPRISVSGGWSDDEGHTHSPTAGADTRPLFGSTYSVFCQTGVAFGGCSWGVWEVFRGWLWVLGGV